MKNILRAITTGVLCFCFFSSVYAEEEGFCDPDIQAVADSSELEMYTYAYRVGVMSELTKLAKEKAKEESFYEYDYEYEYDVNGLYHDYQILLRKCEECSSSLAEGIHKKFNEGEGAIAALNEEHELKRDVLEDMCYKQMKKAKKYLKANPQLLCQEYIEFDGKNYCLERKEPAYTREEWNQCFNWNNTLMNSTKAFDFANWLGALAQIDPKTMALKPDLVMSEDGSYYLAEEFHKLQEDWEKNFHKETGYSKDTLTHFFNTSAQELRDSGMPSTRISELYYEYKEKIDDYVEKCKESLFEKSYPAIECYTRELRNPICWEEPTTAE